MKLFVHRLKDAGFYSFDEWDAFAYDGAVKEAQRALRGRDDQGMPFAGPTTQADDGAPVWAFRQEWLAPDYEQNVATLLTQRNVLHDQAVKLSDECWRRYGAGPTIPPVP